MTKERYLEALGERLRVLPSDERESALRFYTEYFDDAGAENQQQVFEQLGTPEALADRLIREAGVLRPPRPRRKMSVWTWVLVILASPLLLALACVAFGALICVLATLFCVLLALMLLAVTPIFVSAMFVLCGGFVMGCGLMVMFQSLPTMLYYVGCGLVALSIGLWILKPCLALLRRSLRLVFRFSGWMVRAMKSVARPRMA